MMDKSHCFMSANDEHEYELFYDFAKLYKIDEDHQLTQNDA